MLAQQTPSHRCVLAALLLSLILLALGAGDADQVAALWSLRLALPDRSRPLAVCTPPPMATAPGLFQRAASASFRLATSVGRRSASAAAALGPRTGRLSWTSGAGAWGAAAARSRGATCPAAAAGMSSSSGPAAASAAAAEPSLAPSAIIDEEPAPAASGGSGSAASATTHVGAGLATLEGLQFDNRFTAELPADDSEAKHPRQVGAPGAGCGAMRAAAAASSAVFGAAGRQAAWPAAAPPARLLDPLV